MWHPFKVPIRGCHCSEMHFFIIKKTLFPCKQASFSVTISVFELGSTFPNLWFQKMEKVWDFLKLLDEPNLFCDVFSRLQIKRSASIMWPIWTSVDQYWYAYHGRLSFLINNSCPLINQILILLNLICITVIRELFYSSCTLLSTWFVNIFRRASVPMFVAGMWKEIREIWWACTSQQNTHRLI